MPIRRTITTLLVAALGLFAAPLGACDKAKQATGKDEPLPIPDTSSSGKKYAFEQPCQSPLEVLKPEAKSLEATVQQALALVNAEGDDAANFDKFFALMKTTSPKATVRSFIWRNAKKHGKKFLIPGKEKDTALVICRRVTMNDGKVKVFVRSYDEKKLNMPMTLVKVEDGSYKITSYSP